jgi:sortase A
MRVARVLGAIGRFLIGAGVIMLLFVAFQLWGTGLQHARAQDDLADEFDTLLDTAPVDVDLVSVTEPADEGGDDPVVTDGGDGQPQTDELGVTASLTENDLKFIELLYPPNGDVLGKITIARVGLDEFFVEGTGVADLRQGPGHYRSNPLPGQPGNAAIAGHRTTYGAPFNRIDELEPGDEIVITTLQGEFTYRVTPQVDGSGETKGHFIVSPSDTQVLDDFGDNRLTLTACHPKFSASQRIIVVAELVDTPAILLPRPDKLAELEAAATVPVAETAAPDDGDAAGVAAASQGEDSFGEGLNGDRDAIPAAVSWGVAALAIWFTAGWVGRRWRMLPSYALAIVPFLVLLFVAFTYIDRALPSY